MVLLTYCQAFAKEAPPGMKIPAIDMIIIWKTAQNKAISH
jgi:hypothetical protein